MGWLSTVLSIGGGVVGGIVGGPAGAMIGSSLGGMAGSALDGTTKGKGPGTTGYRSDAGKPGSVAYNAFQPQAVTIGQNPNGSMMNIPGTLQYDPTQGGSRVDYTALNASPQQFQANSMTPRTGGLSTNNPRSPIASGATNDLYSQFYGANTGIGNVLGGASAAPKPTFYYNGPYDTQHYGVPPTASVPAPTGGPVMTPGRMAFASGGPVGPDGRQLMADGGAPVFSSPSSGFKATANIDPNYIKNAPVNHFQAQAQVDPFQAQGASSDFAVNSPTNGYNAQQANIATSNYQPEIAQAGNQAQGVGGPATGTIQQMQGLGNTLNQEIQGQGPNLAQWQLQNATQQNIAAAASAAGSQRGINPGLANRQIAGQAASANQNAANQSAGLRMQEQYAAQSQLASLLNQQAGAQLGQQQTGISAMGTAGGLQNQQG
jgi:hypothetical protein